MSQKNPESSPAFIPQVMDIFLLENSATPSRAVALRPCEASLLTLFAGGKSVEVGRILPPDKLFRPAESALVLLEKVSRKVYD